METKYRFVCGVHIRCFAITNDVGYEKELILCEDKKKKKDNTHRAKGRTTPALNTLGPRTRTTPGYYSDIHRNEAMTSDFHALSSALKRTWYLVPGTAQARDHDLYTCEYVVRSLVNCW